MIIIEIAGHLGADVETRVTPDGTKVSTLRVATNIRKGGRDETVWWRATLWGDRWDKILPYLTKGKGVIVIGEMAQKPEIYTTRDGQQQITLEVRAEMVKFSPFGSGGDRSSGGAAAHATPAQTAPSYASTGGSDAGYAPPQTTAGAGSGDFGRIQEDDIPF